MVSLLAGMIELESDSVEFDLELVGSLTMADATGDEIADANLEGFAFGLALGGLDLPGVARAQEFGDEDARWGLEREGSHGGILPKESNQIRCSRANRKFGHKINFRSA